MIRFLATQAALLLVLGVTAGVAGRLALRAVLARGGARGGRAGDGLGPAAELALAGALGLVALGTLGGLLGLAGRLDRVSLLAVVLLVHLAGAGVWREAVSWARRGRGAAVAADRAVAPERRARALPPAAAALAAAAWLAPLFVLALYPPVAFDETLYHLPFARAFAASGGLPFLPDLRFPVFPQLAETLAAGLLLAGGDVATHLPQLLSVLLVAGVLLAWGREWSLDAGPRLAGWLAAAAWLGNPLVVYLAGTGYVEPLLALFVVAACWALWRWRVGRGSGWVALAGAFAGAAAATKYTGLYFVAALGLAALLAAPRAGARRGRAVALFAAAAVLVMAPWYGRLVAHTGNPLFPYLSGVFGANEWTPVRMRDLALPEPAAWLDAVAGGAARIATLPWDAVARRHLVGNVPPLSPVWMVGVPWLLLAALRDRRLRAPLALVAGFVALFPLLPSDTRYLVAVLPLVSLALGLSAEPVLRRGGAARSRAVAAGLAAVLALPGWLYAGYRLALQGPPPATLAAREAWLARALPLYPAVARANALRRDGGTLYGYRAERMRAHVRGRYLSDWYGPHRYARLAPTFGDPRRLRERLRAWEVDYLLVAEPAPELPPALAARAGLALVHADPAARLYAVR